MKTTDHLGRPRLVIDREKAKRLRREGLSVRQIAEEMEISPTTAQRIAVACIREGKMTPEEKIGIPSVCSPDALKRWEGKYRNENFYPDGGHAFCKVCKQEARGVYLYVSIHSNLFGGCAAGGEVEKVLILWCERCQGKPPKILRSCVHV